MVAYVRLATLRSSRFFSMIAVSVLAIVLSSCQLIATNTASPCLEIADVLENRENFAGKIVSVCGWLSVGFEDNNLWSSPLRKNDESDESACLGYTGSENLKANFRGFIGKNVRLEGLVQADFCPINSVCAYNCGADRLVVDKITIVQPIL